MVRKYRRAALSPQPSGSWDAEKGSAAGFPDGWWL